MLTLNAQNEIVETTVANSQVSNASYVGDQTFGYGSGMVGGNSNYLQNYYGSVPVYWNSYPVYVCQDKTKKAIEILKALQADKTIEVKSVTKFIGLVEQIAGLL